MLRRRCFTMQQKIAAVDTVKALGIVEAAKRAGCARSCLDRWRSEIKTLVSTDRQRNRKRLPCKTPKLQSVEVDTETFQWFEEQRALNNGVNGEMLCRKAQQIAERSGLEDFQAGRGWYRHFMRRHGLSLRMKTTMSPELPSDMKSKVLEWHHQVMRIRQEFDIHRLSLMANMDETPIYFDMPYSRTVAVKGSKKVAIRTAGGEKKRVTVVLTVFADGGKAKPLVILRGKRLGKVKVPEGVEVLMHPKAWNSDEGMKTWTSKCLLPYVEGLRRTIAPGQLLLTMDMFRPHLGEEVTKDLKKHDIVPCIIPGGITSLVQPLDVSINKSFKERLRRRWADWMVASDGKTYTKGGKMRCPSKEQLLQGGTVLVGDTSRNCSEKLQRGGCFAASGRKRGSFDLESRKRTLRGRGHRRGR